MAKIRWQATIQDGAGDVQASASVQINTAGAGAATVYSDAAGSGTLTNPLTADADGYVFGYLDTGRYDITATSGGFNITWTDVEIATSEALASGATVAELTITDLNTDQITETVYVSNGTAVDAANGTIQVHALVGNQTPTFTLAAGQSVAVKWVAGIHTLTLSNVNKWIGGSAPATLEDNHWMVFWKDNTSNIIGLDVGGYA